MYKFGKDEINAVVRILYGKKLFRYMEGENSEAARFEKDLCQKMGISYSLLVSSGTAALICGLAAMGIGPGDEVVVPGYTFVATALAPLAVGAVPVICEIDESLTLDVNDLKKIINPKTQAVIPVHMNGFPCCMDDILEVSQAHRLFILEDACQAIGGRYNDKMLGTIGDIGVFSFNQFKILTAGEGGALITNDRKLYQRAFIQHDGSCGNSPYGDRFEEPIFAGLAFRASEITAAILGVQLQKLDVIISDLKYIKATINRTLSQFRFLKPIPSHDPHGECATHAAYGFSAPAEAKKFCHLANKAGLNAYLPGESWHVYSDWEMVLARRGGHHRLRNSLTGTGRVYSGSMCPKTLAILSKTALLECELAMEQDKLERFVHLLENEWTAA
ncbi:MAG: DegT/DnrJ/EryC1/StrS family aminotransferase [Candidatus Aminicenantes bacterium]|jgi:dTDP-4-amino-4,6-dideoxygalactose transaminase